MAKKPDPDFITCMAEDCIGFRMRRLNRIDSSYYDEGLRPFKAKISQINLLIIIARAKQITPSQLGQFAQADTLHFLGNTTDFELTVDSMQIEHESVTGAKKGDGIGLQVPAKVRKKDKVYKIVVDQ